MVVQSTYDPEANESTDSRMDNGRMDRGKICWRRQWISTQGEQQRGDMKGAAAPRGAGGEGFHARLLRRSMWRDNGSETDEEEAHEGKRNGGGRPSWSSPPEDEPGFLFFYKTSFSTKQDLQSFLETAQNRGDA